MKKILLAMLTTLTLTFGSATLFKGTNQSISINSNPEGAKVYIDGQLRGVTPLAVNLKKGLSGKELRIQKIGYATSITNMSKTFDPIAVLNIFWDFSTTDLLTGSLMEYSPNNYFIQLDKKGQWDYNNKYLDKDLLKDINSYILMKYINLKLESKNYNQNAKITNNLILLIKKVNRKPKKEVETLIRKYINESNDAMELLSRIKKEMT